MTLKPFDPDSWTDAIALAYQHLAEARQGLFDAVAEETRARCELEADRIVLIIGGITGKNAEEREASLRHELAGKYRALEESTAKTAEERLDYDLAGLEVDRIKLTIRALELDAGK